MNEREGIEILTASPRRALLKLSAPMIVNNVVFTLYNIADGIWVAGLGANALAALGIFFPLFMIFIALSFGLSVASSSAISRKIGAQDIQGARMVAMHAFAMAVFVSALIMSLIFNLEYALRILGAEEEVLRLSIEYGSIMVLGSFLLVFNSVSAGLLNGEGNAKRAMIANVMGSTLNIVLDPIFIYVLSLGVAGAAYASVISLFVSSLVFIYWFYNGKSHIKPSFGKWNWKMAFDLFRVGIPVSIGMIVMSASLIFINRIILATGGGEGIAIYTAVWRLMQIGFIPLFGISGALTAVSGASYGARNAINLKKAYYYALKLTIRINTLILAFLLLFAPQISYVFAYTEESLLIYDGLVSSLRILAFILLFAPIGIATSSTFQGMGKGEKALALTLLRVSIQVLLAYFLALAFGIGFEGVLLGVVFGDAISAIFAFSWIRVEMSKV
ncbi:MAG: MATE family efflux transporter [Archaeoglobaceae archaeon]